jgi:hypothetical protein
VHLEINHNDWIALENFPPKKVFAFHLFILVLVCRCIYTLHNKNKIWQFKENLLKPKLHYPSLHIIANVNIHEYIHQKDLTNHENSKNHTSFRTCIMAQKKLKENKLSWTREHELSWALNFAREHSWGATKRNQPWMGPKAMTQKKVFFKKSLEGLWFSCEHSGAFTNSWVLSKALMRSSWERSNSKTCDHGTRYSN